MTLTKTLTALVPAATVTVAITLCALTLSPSARAQGPIPISAASNEADRQTILSGVNDLRAPGGLVGGLILVGPQAFRLVEGGGEGTPIVAAAHAGKGRVLVVAHNNFLSAEGLANSGNARFLSQGVSWLSGRAKRGVHIGVVGEGEAATALGSAATWAAVTTLRPSDLTPARLAQIDVLIVNPDAFTGPNGEAKAATVGDFVRAGGGLLTYGVGWGWQQMHPEERLPDAGFNRLLVPLAGIGCTGGVASPTGKDGEFLASRPSPPEGSGEAFHALTLLESHSEGKDTLSPAEAALIGRTLAAACDVLPDSDTTFLPRLRSLLTKSGYAPGTSVEPTKFAPMTLAEPVARIAALLEARQIAATPMGQKKAHPSAAAFPGRVPGEATRVSNRVVEVDTAVPDWHSTGLYAAPGETITVTLPENAVGRGLGVRIGAHKDLLWEKESWPRFPQITVEKRITGRTLKLACAFGGTVYITVPGTKEASGIVPVTISGAVIQPYFVRNKTTAAEWATLRDAPAPWAELQGDKVILTVPSMVVRTLRDPSALVAYWDEVADAAADLYAIPHERRRQERYCVDVEISAGYMHSGYPIMVHDDVAATMVSVRTLRGTDGDKTWGFYHELGHNHQRPEWTWEGCGEVTNNLFSLYGDEKFNAVDANYTGSHGAVAPATRRARLVKYSGRRCFVRWLEVRSLPYSNLLYSASAGVRVGIVPKGLRRVPCLAGCRASAHRAGEARSILGTLLAGSPPKSRPVF